LTGSPTIYLVIYQYIAQIYKNSSCSIILYTYTNKEDQNVSTTICYICIKRWSLWFNVLSNRRKHIKFKNM
jgi:hypothetical protein